MAECINFEHDVMCCTDFLGDWKEETTTAGISRSIRRLAASLHIVDCCCWGWGTIVPAAATKLYQRRRFDGTDLKNLFGVAGVRGGRAPHKAQLF